MATQYEVIEYKGQPARKYPDGSIRNERGHWLEAHPEGHTITQADASTLANARYAKAQERVRAAVLAEVKGIADIPHDTPEDAYAFVVAKQTVALIDSDKPRMDDVEKLGQIMDMIPRRGQESDTGAAQAITAGLQAETAYILNRLWDDVRRTQRGQALPQVVDVIPTRSDIEADTE